METITFGNARFTFIEAGILRMECSEIGCFCDWDTLFSKKEYPESEAKVLVSYGNGSITLESDRIKIRYLFDGRTFCRENLFCRLKMGRRSKRWYPGRKDKGNLGGAVSTLDGCDGTWSHPAGVLSTEGWYFHDDSDTGIIWNGKIFPRDKRYVCDWYLFAYGTDLKEGLRMAAKVSGQAVMPRKRAFGSWYSRWYPYSEEEILKIAEEYSENGFPLDIAVIDMDWHHNDWQTPPDDPHRAVTGHGHAGNLGWTGYSWNRRLIPDPKGMIEKLGKTGIAVTLNDHPADGIRPCEDCYEEFAKLMGLENGESLPFSPEDPRYMEAFFRCAHRPHDDMGVDFWWLDWQQNYLMDHVPGIPGQPILPWLNRLYFEDSKRGGREGMIYSRYGGLGDQKYPIFFSGDTAALWETLRYEVENTVVSGNSMCFFWAHDIGGFFEPEERRDGELFVRWVQFGAMSAAMKLHSTGENLDRRPWTWGEPYSGAMREAFRLRSRLFPFIYSAAVKSCRDSVPFIEPLYLEYPGDREAFCHGGEYLIGGALLVCPVTFPSKEGDGRVTVPVYLPEGKWFNFFTGEWVEGGRTVDTDCTLETFPLFVKAHSLIPVQPYREHPGSTPFSDLEFRYYLPCGETVRSVEFTLFDETLDETQNKASNGAESITEVLVSTDDAKGSSIVFISA